MLSCMDGFLVSRSHSQLIAHHRHYYYRCLLSCSDRHSPDAVVVAGQDCMLIACQDQELNFAVDYMKNSLENLMDGNLTN